MTIRWACVSLLSLGCSKQLDGTTWRVSAVESASHARPMAGLAVGVELVFEPDAVLMRSGGLTKRIPASMQPAGRDGLSIRFDSLTPPRTASFQRTSVDGAELTGLSEDATFVLREVRR